MASKSLSEIKTQILRNSSLDYAEHILGQVRCQVPENAFNNFVIELAICFKFRQEYALAVDLLKKYRDLRSVTCHLQLSLCLSALGHDKDALRESDRALNCLKLKSVTGDDIQQTLSDEIILNHIILLARLNEFNKAHHFCNYIESNAIVDPGTQIWMREIICFFHDFPPSRIIKVISQLIATSNMRSIGQFYDDLIIAISQKKSFTMIRLDDGEGSNLPWDAYSRSRFGSLILRNRDIFLGHWFGSANTKDILDQQWYEIQNKLAIATKNVDVVGLNKISRIKHELSINSLRGILSIFNTYRWCFWGKPITSAEFMTDSCQQFANHRYLVTAQIHYEIGLSSREFFSILSKAVKVVLISCRENAALLLAQKLDVPNILTWIEIPSEKLKLQTRFVTQEIFSENQNQQVKNPSSSESYKSFSTIPCPKGQPHYPDRYHDVCKIIKDLSQPGVVFLVAAGLLAKIYVYEAKQCGAIALDIGSLADIYAGIDSRGFDKDMISNIRATYDNS